MKTRAIKSKNIKWWIGIISCIALFAVISVFGYKNMCFVFKGVEINASIEKSSDTSLATVIGKAPRATHLTLNGREIFVDKDGNFNETISVLPGFSVITINAEDKFGKTAEEKFEMVYEGNAPAIAMRGSSD